MKILTVMLTVLMFGQRLAGADHSDKTDATLAQLRTAARCDDTASSLRVWCIGADYNKGQLGTLPEKSLVGVSVELKFDGDANKALLDSVSPSALAVDKSGKVKLTMIKPTSKAEETMTGEAVFSLAAYFKGKTKTAKLPKDLAGYIATLKPAYATTRGKTAWTWKGATTSEMRKVGDHWVVIERPAGGIIVTIFTDQWE